ncbi:hypothetical protein HK101_002655 [Irineochytrium annulatum]|nr:hypothetical protein HK101_002655 [Irineochytrium annulatum]
MIKAAKVKSIGRIIKQAHGTKMTNSLKKTVVNQTRQFKLMIDDYNDVLLGEKSAGKASEDDPDDEEDLGDETVDDGEDIDARILSLGKVYRELEKKPVSDIATLYWRLLEDIYHVKSDLINCREYLKEQLEVVLPGVWRVAQRSI